MSMSYPDRHFTDAGAAAADSTGLSSGRADPALDPEREDLPER